MRFRCPTCELWSFVWQEQNSNHSHALLDRLGYIVKRGLHGQLQEFILYIRVERHLHLVLYQTKISSRLLAKRMCYFFFGDLLLIDDQLLVSNLIISICL